MKKESSMNVSLQHTYISSIVFLLYSVYYKDYLVWTLQKLKSPGTGGRYHGSWSLKVTALQDLYQLQTLNKSLLYLLTCMLLPLANAVQSKLRAPSESHSQEMSKRNVIYMYSSFFLYLNQLKNGA